MLNILVQEIRQSGRSKKGRIDDISEDMKECRPTRAWCGFRPDVKPHYRAYIYFLM